MNTIKTIRLKRDRKIETEVFEDGTIGIELEKDCRDESQYAYFILTQNELQLLINLLADTQQMRRNYLKELNERKVNV